MHLYFITEIILIQSRMNQLIRVVSDENQGVLLSCRI